MPDSPHETINSADIYNVTRLNREVRAVLEGSFPRIWVTGEISNLAQPGSGHIYFSLKDDQSQVRCAMFQNRRRQLRFDPANGLSVLLRADISLYENRGEYQLIVDYMEPAGAGALQRALEELKQKLQKEGLFDEQHKLTVPSFPTRIGIITSPTGAAIRDILHVLKRRFPAANIFIYPVQVQGDEAPVQIIHMLKLAQVRNECDVLLLARGGGSLEDLWAFNNEQLAREIYQCSIPVVTGIGHEIDFTIADFVADRRAPTPSAAAELISPDQLELTRQLSNYELLLSRHCKNLIGQHRNHLLHLQKRLPHPARQLQLVTQRLDEIYLRLQRQIQSLLGYHKTRLQTEQTRLAAQNPLQRINQYLQECRQLERSFNSQIRNVMGSFRTRLEQLMHNLDTISPLATLERGYTIVQKKDQAIVRNSEQLVTGEKIHARFGKGSAECIVEKLKK